MSYGYRYSYRGGAQGARGPQIALSASSVLENAVSGSTVGVLSVVGGTGTWAFTEVADPDNKFVLAGTGGSNLNTNGTFNYATAVSHSVTISATNGTLTIQRTFSIIVRATGVATLTDPVDQYIGTNAANLTVSTNRNNGTLYWYVSPVSRGVGGFGAGNIDIKTGNGAILFGSQPVTAAGVQTVPLTGLSPATRYYTYWIHENNGADSNLVRAGGFVTDSTIPGPRVVNEGDSITFWAHSINNNGSYARRWEEANPTLAVVNQGFTSAVIGLPTDTPGFNSLWGRARQTIANNPTILTIQIGANDLAAINNSSAWLQRLYDYIDHMWANCPNLQHVLVSGVLPQRAPVAAAATNNAQRAIVNPILRAGGGTRPGGGPRITGYIPFGDAIPDDYVGVDIISADGVHPEVEGRKLMFRIFSAVMDPLIAGATGNNPAAFTLIDQNNVALNGTATAEVLVTGMGVGATAMASQTGGRIARGPASVSGGTIPFGTSPVTVCNGDFVRVEATGAATNDTDTNVALTIGTRADTFTARTRRVTQVEFEHSTDGRLTHNSYSGGQSIFTNVAFPAGRPVLMVREDGNNEAGVTINGVAAERVGGAVDTTTRHSLWIGPPSQILTAGNYEVRVTSSNNNAWISIGPGAIRNCVQEVSTMQVRRLARASYTDRALRTTPTLAVRNGALALYAYAGLTASFNSFLEGSNVFAYPDNPADSGGLHIRYGQGRVSGDLGVGVVSATGQHALIVVELLEGVPPDDTPNAAGFTDQTNPDFQAYTSGNWTLAGLEPATTFTTGSFSAVNGATYTKNGVAGLTASPFTYANGDVFSIEATPTISGGTARGTLVMGGTTETFGVIPGITTDAAEFTDVVNAATSTGFSSNTITFSGIGAGFVIPATISLPPGWTYTLNGTPGLTATSFNYSRNNTLSIQGTSSASNGTTLEAVVTLAGGATRTYSIATAAGGVPNNPPNQSDLLLRLDAYDLANMFTARNGTGVVAANGDFVGSMNNKAPGGTLLASNQDTRRASITDVSTFPAINFNTQDRDNLRLTGGFGIINSIKNNSLTLIYTATYRADGAAMTLLHETGTDGGNTVMLELRNAGTSILNIRFTDSADVVTTVALNTSGEWFNATARTYCVDYDGTTWRLYVDKVLRASATTAKPAFLASTTPNLGVVGLVTVRSTGFDSAINQFSEKFYGALLFNSRLSDSARDSNTEWAAAKYLGVTL